ncbi:hypothetical protein WOLCODRAFT_148483 [Wolfiporia cocos MD-104 SS10]|uniref:Uncharacterized protein n=1 Tax=Wolfiporia cocos (strain MD-104) TaxID=742152 RepID=A0A2H3IXI2_WOLCO|nr:hypothetical protein WOLCODRAFT_148483 [Wolfiporia cocos MD-104 SS10]
MALFAERQDVSAWDVWRKHKGAQKKAEREYSREVSNHAEEGTSEVLGGAQWTKAAMEEYATLSHEEKARLQEEADRANKERREVEFNGNNEFIRAEKVRNLGEILGKLAKQIEEELGWVVLFMAGSVDKMGNVSDLIHTTAKQSNGKDFITHLAEQLQISPPRLGNEWFNFIEDIYDLISVQHTGKDRGQESGDTTKTVDSTKAGGDGEFNKGKDTMTTPWEVEDSGEGTSNIGSGASNVTSSEGDVLRGEGDDGGRLDVATDGGEALCAIDMASRPSTENSHSTDDMADRTGQRKLESGGDVQMAAGEASQEVLRAFSGSQCAGEAAVKASGVRGALGKAAQKKSTRGKLWADSSAEQVTDTIPMIAGRVLGLSYKKGKAGQWHAVCTTTNRVWYPQQTPTPKGLLEDIEVQRVKDMLSEAESAVNKYQKELAAHAQKAINSEVQARNRKKREERVAQNAAQQREKAVKGLDKAVERAEKLGINVRSKGGRLDPVSLGGSSNDEEFARALQRMYDDEDSNDDIHDGRRLTVFDRYTLRWSPPLGKVTKAGGGEDEKGKGKELPDGLAAANRHEKGYRRDKNNGDRTEGERDEDKDDERDQGRDDGRPEGDILLIKKETPREVRVVFWTKNNARPTAEIIEVHDNQIRLTDFNIVMTEYNLTAVSFFQVWSYRNFTWHGGHSLRSRIDIGLSNVLLARLNGVRLCPGLGLEIHALKLGVNPRLGDYSIKWCWEKGADVEGVWPSSDEVDSDGGWMPKTISATRAGRRKTVAQADKVRSDRGEGPSRRDRFPLSQALTKARKTPTRRLLDAGGFKKAEMSGETISISESSEEDKPARKKRRVLSKPGDDVIDISDDDPLGIAVAAAIDRDGRGIIEVLSDST